MNRYIDADALISILNNKANMAMGTCKEVFFSVARMVELLPTADVVGVVRCKDCRYYEIHKPTITLNCEREGKLIPMMPNDYCSFGERREG